MEPVAMFIFGWTLCDTGASEYKHSYRFHDLNYINTDNSELLEVLTWGLSQVEGSAHAAHLSVSHVNEESQWHSLIVL